MTNYNWLALGLTWFGMISGVMLIFHWLHGIPAVLMGFAWGYVCIFARRKLYRRGWMR